MPSRNKSKYIKMVKGRNKVMHIPSSIGNSVAANNATTFFPAQPVTAYLTAGSAITGDTHEDADRNVSNIIGSKIATIFNTISFRDVTVNGIMEIALFKVERANAVPTVGGGLLPTTVAITGQGLQQAMRQFQPGRVLKYLKAAIAAEQPRVVHAKHQLFKFNMSTMRAGDYIGIIVYNRSSAAVTVDFESRYNAFD